ncbi:MAG: glyoxalase [Chloroflexi bacterium UTCFX4]|jgi:catechol 2,3-dioxygenase-like lactoylglutathione lyase family enzyme|nr:MAG: glyoxalase [Chloroflexi bacterium UTCFX4]
MLANIHHVQIAAPRACEDAARKFYGELLGLREIAKPPELKKRGGVWFELRNGQQLHIGIEQDFVAPQKAHPAFAAINLNALREKLNAAGYATQDDDLFIGYNRFYARDPFGNRIEFVEPLAQ